MSRVSVRALVPGGVEQAEALWYDLGRWPAYVDGFAAVVRCDDAWPASGTLIWNSTPAGRGRVIERVVRQAPGEGQVSEVEDERLHGIQTVAFEPGRDGTVMTIGLEYALKERNPFTPLIDVFFIRRAIRDALQRTATRFAREREGDLEM